MKHRIFRISTKTKSLLGAGLFLFASLGFTHNISAQERIAFYAPAVATSTSKKGVTTTTTNNQIFTMDTDGGNVRQLTSGTDNCFTPKWDKGQQHILFFRGNDLHVINADGSGDFTVVTGTYGGKADWSPDGKQICYGGYDSIGWSGLLIVNVDPTARSLKNRVGTPVLVRKGTVYGPDWSPDGNKIVFSSYPPGGPYITVLDLTTGAETLFSSMQGLTPAFNSDGTKIAFSGQTGVDDTGSTIWELFIASSDFADLVQVTNFNNTFVVWTTWSPDNTQLAFRLGSGQAWDASIYKLSLSSGSMALLRRPADGPSWRP